MFEKSLDGKVALVTGGSRGIGRGICVALANRGAQVVVNYTHNEAEAVKTASIIESNGCKKPLVKKFDVGNSGEVDAAIKEIVDQFGSLDILVNNAGITRDGLIMRYKDEDFAETMRVDLAGAFYCSRACARPMMKKRFGRIINISSVVGEMGNGGQTAYGAAKAGLLGFTKSLAKELASRGITVNAVTPGCIETDMTSSLSKDVIDAYVEGIPLGYLGSVEDVAHAVTFLAQDEARYITGHCLAVNGGMYM